MLPFFIKYYDVRWRCRRNFSSLLRVCLTFVNGLSWSIKLGIILAWKWMKTVCMVQNVPNALRYASFYERSASQHLRTIKSKIFNLFKNMYSQTNVYCSQLNSIDQHILINTIKDFFDFLQHNLISSHQKLGIFKIKVNSKSIFKGNSKPIFQKKIFLSEYQIKRWFWISWFFIWTYAKALFR